MLGFSGRRYSAASQPDHPQQVGNLVAVELTELLEEHLPTRAAAQLRFMLELDRLKLVLRQTLITDGSRQENSAEHSWHLATAALLLAEHAAEEIDLTRVVRLALLHDIVEIDAGDTFCYDAAGSLDKGERERQAAERIFGLLPADQAAEWRAAWEEFELGETAEARFAHALDRLQPMLQNLATGGGTWRRHGIGIARVRARMAPIRAATPGLGPFVEAALERAVGLGWILPAEAGSEEG